MSEQEKKKGYENLLCYQVAKLVYEITVVFTEKFMDSTSGNKEAMIQLASNGVRNIEDGSKAFTDSRETELKLTKLAQESLIELKNSFEEFLKHKNFELLDYRHPILLRLKEAKPNDLLTFRGWVQSELILLGKDQTLTSSCIVANGALSLINLASYLLGRLIEYKAKNLETKNGKPNKPYKVKTIKEGDQVVKEPGQMDFYKSA